MSDRYFVDSPTVADHAVLTGAEAHHLLHVMRAAVGTSVTLFDGSGWEFEAVIQRTSRAEVELAINSRHQIDREPAIALTLGVALPKGERQKWLVEKATELGVARLVPLVTERAVVQPGENLIERLRRGVIEASKQCGRNRLMQIAEPQSWKAFLDDSGQIGCRVVAHVGATAGPALGGCTTIVAAVGPEGGFTNDEITLAASDGWQLVGLGPRTLRAETAALALAAIAISQVAY